MTAISRATATFAFFMPIRFASLHPPDLEGAPFLSSEKATIPIDLAGLMVSRCKCLSEEFLNHMNHL
jgi:hypothetical protein